MSITAAQMRALEQRAVEQGTSLQQLMENAGSAVAREVKARFPGKRVLVVCYHGNNGGDGFVTALRLLDACRVRVLFLGKEDRLKEEGRHFFSILKINQRNQRNIFVETCRVDWKNYDVIVDAVFGTGFTATKVGSDIASVFEAINGSDAFVVSIDVPSGVNCDTGEKANAWVEADLVVTFHDKKPCLENIEAEVVVKDIGIANA